MKNRYRVKIYQAGLIAVFTAILPISASSQIFHSGKPIYNPSTDTLFVPEIKITIDPEDYPQKAKKGDGLKMDLFAVPVKTDISPLNYGVWYEKPELNKKIWLLKISAEGAASLNLILEPFELKRGAKLFFYDLNQKQVLGAITYENNKETGVLPVSIIRGSSIICELQIPMYQTDYGIFRIEQVGVELKKNRSLKSTADYWFGHSSYCNVNANCYNDNQVINNNKNAVCRIIYFGSNRCTGTLINNLENDGTPYILTAGHCINTEYAANRSVFYFKYESPGCEDIDGPLNTISGASLVSAGFHGDDLDTLDFALLKLSEDIPPAYYPFFAGWDATGDVPASTYVIHHPEGDIKKISFDEDAPLTSSYGKTDPNTHWVVSEYEVGTTDLGSSGSALMTDNDLIIGSLTSGGNPCESPIYDKYQKLSHAYADYEDTIRQLKHWLDPNNTDKKTCNSFDAAGAFRKSAEKVNNYELLEPSGNEGQKSGWGYLAGHNYQLNTIFAEKFQINGSKYIYGANLNPIISYSNSEEQKIVFTIWEGGSVPGDIVYEKELYLNLVDTGIHEINLDSTVLVDSEFYLGYRISYSSDTFSVRTYPVTSSSNSAFTYINGSWNPLQFDGEDYHASLGIEAVVFDMMPVWGVLPDSAYWDDLKLYPNPVSESVQLYFKNEIPRKIELRIYDLNGMLRNVQTKNSPSSNNQFDIGLPDGIYILKVVLNESEIRNYKILVVH